MSNAAAAQGNTRRMSIPAAGPSAGPSCRSGLVGRGDKRGEGGFRVCETDQTNTLPHISASLIYDL